jgi:hypothetical protein
MARVPPSSEARRLRSQILEGVVSSNGLLGALPYVYSHVDEVFELVASSELLARAHLSGGSLRLPPRAVELIRAESARWAAGFARALAAVESAPAPAPPESAAVECAVEARAAVEACAAVEARAAVEACAPPESAVEARAAAEARARRAAVEACAAAPWLRASPRLQSRAEAAPRGPARPKVRFLPLSELPKRGARRGRGGRGGRAPAQY